MRIDEIRSTRRSAHFLSSWKRPRRTGGLISNYPVALHDVLNRNVSTSEFCGCPVVYSLARSPFIVLLQGLTPKHSNLSSVMASRLDVSGPCASCNLCISYTRDICRAGMGVGETRLSLVPSFLNDQKILEQTGESFISWHTKLPSLSCASPFIPRLAYQHHDPNTSHSDPYLTTLHPTPAIDYFLSRLLGPLPK